MARIFAGDPAMVDQEVLDALKQLPDTYWVLAEFTIGRNIDWFIIRPNTRSTLILTELKRMTTPVRGAVNGPWERITSSGEWEELPTAGTDTNPYWQSVNAANTLADWLWNNQHWYRETADVRPASEFRVWPDLLLLSPPGITHRLPLAPTSRYGRWWFSIDDWLRHVRGWTPRTGITLTHQEVANLVATLRLTEIWPGGESDIDQQPRIMEPASVDVVEMFSNWLKSLEQRVARLEQELAWHRQQEREQSRILLSHNNTLTAAAEDESTAGEEQDTQDGTAPQS